MRSVPAAFLALIIAGCAGPSTGPVKGVLVVYSGGMEMETLDGILDDLQKQVVTVEPEAVFDFSVCTPGEFHEDLRTRRTILFLAGDPSELPSELEFQGDIYYAEDVWARGQRVFGAVLDGSFDPALLSDRLEEAYSGHLQAYLYGSFVSTQMSSPDRIDSLLALGFSIDIPKSYSLSEWEPETGFIQYQRRVSDICLLLLSVRWIEDDVVLSPDEAVTWREEVARNHFYDSSADSVDRSMVQVEPMELRGMEGWKLLGMWRNPEHLNAGAFTSYVLRSDGRRYLLDMEVFHERREKEPYIREGWIMMNTFIPGDEDGR
ncbi:MAG: hypothetical protein AVO35_07195 [Candidatus Aegiribacteria sp. MLS_C]|nr:MAG: hypothetical protein AVO35_07195 [Candidatus Aegiribacteria sp. MLS_C]